MDVDTYVGTIEKASNHYSQRHTDTNKSVIEKSSMPIRVIPSSISKVALILTRVPLKV